MKNKELCTFFLVGVFALFVSSCQDIKPAQPDDPRWILETQSSFVNTPIVYTDGTLLAITFEGVFYNINTTDGNVIWTTAIGERVVHSPVLDENGAIYVLTAKEHVIKYVVQNGAPVVAWKNEIETRTADPYGGEWLDSKNSPGDTIVLGGNFLYVANGKYNELRCLSRDNGQDVGDRISLRSEDPSEKGLYYTDFRGIRAVKNGIDYDVFIMLARGEYLLVKDGVPLKRFFYANRTVTETSEFPFMERSFYSLPLVYMGKVFFLVAERELPDANFQFLAVESGGIPRNLSLVPIGSNGVDEATKISLEWDWDTLAIAGIKPDFLATEEAPVINGSTINIVERKWSWQGSYVMRWNISTGKFMEAFGFDHTVINPSNVPQIQKRFFEADGILYEWLEFVGSIYLNDTIYCLYRIDMTKPDVAPVKCVQVPKELMLGSPLFIDGLLIIPFANHVLCAYGVDSGLLSLPQGLSGRTEASGARQ